MYAYNLKFIYEFYETNYHIEYIHIYDFTSVHNNNNFILKNIK